MAIATSTHGEGDEVPGAPARVAEPVEATSAMRRLPAIRWVFLLVQSAFLAFSYAGFGMPLPWSPILPICAFQAILTIPNLWRWVAERSSENIAAFAQILIDVLALSGIAYFAGGSMNPLISLYLPLIAVGATLLQARQAAFVAIFSVAAYSFVSLFHATAHIHDPQQALRIHLIGMWLIFVCSALTISVFVVRLNATIRRRDRALAVARETGLRNERVVALGNLAAGAAHELGTPLATMTVVVGELANQSGLPEALRPDVELVLRQLRECKEIITRLAARAGSSRAEGAQPICADRWLMHVVERWERQRPDVRPDVTFDGPIPGPRIAADITLERALLNLLNNAADASPDSVEVRATWNDRNIETLISDRGGGIPPDLARRLGVDFVSTREEGAGIGVLLALSAIEQCGGRLDFAPRAGGGTMARVALPLESLGALDPAHAA
jgi:two-component system sensor histidine kinase RegB